MIKLYVVIFAQQWFLLPPKISKDGKMPPFRESAELHNAKPSSNPFARHLRFLHSIYGELRPTRLNSFNEKLYFYCEYFTKVKRAQL